MNFQNNLPKLIKNTLASRQPRPVEEDRPGYRHAAVLIPIFKEEDLWKVLFTERTHIVETHKGQISFPGGSVDKGDPSAEYTALREAHEEVGLLTKDVDILGRTDDVETVASEFIIHPVVGRIPFPYDFRLSPHEVESLIRVPLEVFHPDTSFGEPFVLNQDGMVYEGTAYKYNGHLIWGATARMMENFMEIIGSGLS